MQLAARPLLACRSCARHVFADETSCPFCGLVLQSSSGPARALFAGGVAAALAATGCGGMADGAADGIGGGSAQIGGGQGGAAAAQSGGATGAQSGGSAATQSGGSAGTQSGGSAGAGGATFALPEAGPVQDASKADVRDTGPCPYGMMVMDVCEIPTLYRSPPPLPRRA